MRLFPRPQAGLEIGMCGRHRFRRALDRGFGRIMNTARTTLPIQRNPDSSGKP